MSSSLSITTGAGTGRPQGREVTLPPEAPVDAIKGTLLRLPSGDEAWWSPHSWKGAYRLEKSWTASCAAVVDVDFMFKRGCKRTRLNPALIRDPALSEVEALAALASSGLMPGTNWHPTPGGARVIAMFAEPCTDRDLAIKAIAGLCALVGDLLGDLPYEVDFVTSLDLARLFYTPNAFAKGVQRRAEVSVLRVEPYTPQELAEHAPPPEEKPAPTVPFRRPTTGRPSNDIPAAIEKWNADHPLDLPRHSAPCPVCNDSGSFGHLPDDKQRWYCFSSDHPDEVGVRGGKGFHGDALDLDCFYRGLKKVELLRDDGYLPPKRSPAPPPQREAPPADDDEGDDEEPRTAAPVARIEDHRRPLRNGSYLTALTIVRHNLRDVLGGRKIELNEMSGRPEIGRRPMRDEDVSTIRAEIELRHKGGIDKNNNETGLKLSESDVDAAVRQVAAENVYHPVRDYLSGLKWDKTPRLDHVAADILNAENTPLNQAMVRKFFISAVARAMEPGCKVDTVLILAGKQGKKKSTFFKIIGAPWFADSNVDVRNKDAFAVIRDTWIFEWGEFGKMMRIDIDTVKSFTASCVDKYRPSHGRYVIDVPRSGVFVASVNPDEFLVDDENRRWWILKVGAVIEYAIAREQRDQLWAEALHFFREWVARGRHDEECPWWLNDEEAEQLEIMQRAHVVSDAWEEKILNWADIATRLPFTTSEVLGGPIGKDPGMWTKADEMRVARVLKGAGFERKSEGAARAKKWRRVS